MDITFIRSVLVIFLSLFITVSSVSASNRGHNDHNRHHDDNRFDGYHHHDDKSGQYDSHKKRKEWKGQHKGCNIKGNHHHDDHNTPLNCQDAVAAPNKLWPANHKFNKISIDGLSTSDGSAPSITYQCVFQDEPFNDTGDGNTDVDAKLDSGDLFLRKERAGNGNGRVYHVDFLATDNSNGDSCEGTVVVEVPHNKKGMAKDDGRLYTSLAIANNCGGSEKQVPVITSSPVTDATATLDYTYAVIVLDADNDVLGYELVESPEGMTIDSDGIILWLPNDSQVGDHAVSIAVDDGNGGQATQNYILSVTARPNSAPVISSTPALNAIEAQAYSYSVQAVDPDGDAISFSLSLAPTGMEINESGLIQWAPIVGQAGDHSVSLLVTDIYGAIAQQNFVIIVSPKPNDAPVITSTPVLNVAEGNNYLYVVTVTDPNSDPVTLSLTEAPIGLVLNQNSLSWIPDFNQAGEYPITVLATDSNGASASQSYTLTVLDTNQLPVITSTPLLIANEGEFYQYSVVASDVDGDALQYSLELAPEGMLVSDSGLIEWLPGYEVAGVHEVQVKVDDGKQGTATQQYSLDVINTNRDPQITSQPIITATENIQYEYQVTTSDDDGDVIQFNLVNAPAGMIIGNDGLISWLPDYNTAGDHAVNIEITDGIAIVTQSFVTTVTNSNQPPISDDVSVTTDEDSAVVITLTASDSDGDALTYAIETDPQHGTVTINANEATYTPVANFNGQDTFTFTSNDGTTISNSATVTVDIAPINDVPVFNTLPTTTATENQSYASFVSAIDIDGDVLAYNLDAGPLGLTINSVTGEINWTPSFEQSGSHSVTMSVSDGVATQSLNFEILVTNVNRAPTISSSPITTANENEIYSYQVVAQDPDVNDVLSYSLAVSPTGMTINSNTGLVNWIPSVAQIGTNSISVQVTDQGGLVDVQTFAIDVVSANAAPEFTSVPTSSSLSNHEYIYNPRAVDPDGDTLVYRQVQIPVGATLASWGQLKWTPTDADVGEHAVIIMADDNKGGRTLQEFTITVAQSHAPEFTTTPITSVILGYDYAYDARAIDADGDTIIYRWWVKPTEMTQDLSGRLRWTPTNSDVGFHPVTILADDRTGKFTTQEFLIAVIPNGAPIFNSTPIITALVGQSYVYKLIVTDPESEAVTLNLLSAPNGLQLNTDQTISWDPLQADIGDHPVVLEATDTFGNKTRQEYILTVNTNSAPTIVSKPPRKALEHNTYLYDVKAVDLDVNDIVQYLISQSGFVDGVAIDNNSGVLSWTGSNAIPYFDTNINPSCSIPKGTDEPYLDVTNWQLFRHIGEHGGIQDFQVLDGGTTAKATGNGDPTFFMSDVEQPTDSAIEISVRNEGGDDDWFGFVWGMEDLSHYYRLRWLPREGGITVSKIQTPDWRERYNGEHITDKVLYSNTKLFWKYYVDYKIILDVKPGNTSIHIMDGEEIVESIQLEEDTSIGGRFAFYVHSQDSVYYKARFIPRTPSPDLIVDNVTADFSSTENTYNVTVTNRGAATTVSPTDVVVNAANYDNTLGDVNPVEVGNTIIPILESGESYTFQLQSSLNIDSYQLLSVDIDPARVNNAECNQENNKKLLPVVTVIATDLGGLTDTQKVVIDPTNVNDSLVINSIPPSYAISNEAFKYYLSSTDADIGDHVSYELLEGPAGMQFYLGSRLLVWTPHEEELYQSYPVKILAKDLSGTEVQQNFDITVQQKPTIVSSPIEVARQNVLYQYQVKAIDPEGDLLTYRLVKAPAGMTINPETGLIEWTSAISSLFEEVVVEVTDNKAGVDRQSFTVFVLKITWVNVAPTIISQPSLTAPLLQNYSYDVNATDPDGGTLLYQLTESPSAMLIDSSTGLITWRPAITQSGKFKVVVKVNDRRGGVTYQSFTLSTQSTGGNAAPSITSTPANSVFESQPYVYQIIATDPEGDVLDYQLTNSPLGMSVDTNGLLTWTPLSSDIGTQSIVIKIMDSVGNFAQQKYDLTVLAESVTPPPNQTPMITSTPSQEGYAGYHYSYQVVASDPDGDSLNYSLQNNPVGMTITNQGLISWLPTVGQAGIHSVAIRVDDARAFATQTYDIAVLSQAAPIIINATVTPNPVNLGESTTLSIFGSGGVGVLTYSLSIDGVEVVLDSQNQATITPTNIGKHDVSIVATDGLNITTTSNSFVVLDPSDLVAPIAEITTPTNMQIITEPTSIIGTASDDNLVEYRLAYSQSGKNEWTIWKTGTTSVINGELGVLDPSVLFNGLYDLALEVTDINDQKTTSAITVQVEGDLKVGNFSITLEDVNIPMVGIPIQVSRTYDSRQKNENLDFGFGWSINYQNVRVDESRVPGSYWQLNQYPAGPLGILQRYCVEPQGAPVVTVTLPDGNTEKFETSASPRCNDVSPILDVELKFDSVGDTQSSLVALNNSSARLQGGNLVETSTFSTPINPSRYKLTTQSGYEYFLNQDFGVEKIIDPNGNTLTYTDDGIFHSAGKSIAFNRDAQGRITSITDPAGNVAMSYQYDVNGDLINNVDAMTAKMDYTYNSNHGLLDIIDPLGRTLVKNIYDDSGKLIAQEDNSGNRTSFDHDIAGRQSVVTDRNNNTTIFYYNERGDVLTQVDANQEQTTFTYDAKGNQLSKLNALGVLETATFDEDNNQLTQTDALLNTTTFTYNQRGQEETIVDTQGNTFAQVYDGIGNLLQITDPLGNIAANTVNAKGLVDSTTDTLGNTTSYTYDSEGNKLTETNAEGVTTTYTYDDNNNVLTESQERTLSDGSKVVETMHYEYDAKNRVTATVNALGQRSETEYDLAGQVIAEVDASGRRTEMDYDAYGRVLETRYPDGTQSTKTYDPEGNVLTDTNRNGETTTYEYDALNRQVAVIDAQFNRSETEYDAIGRVTAQIDAKLNRTEFEYDEVGRRTLTRNQLGQVHRFEYDENGNLVAEVDALNHRTEYLYNELDQRIETRYHDGSNTLETLDALGRRVTQTDQAGITTQYEYDKLGRLTAVIDVQGNRTEYSYDEAGNKLTQTDAEGRTTRWTYDALGRVLSRQLPMGQTETFTYNNIGQLIAQSDFNGNITIHEYYPNDQLKRSDFADGSAEAFSYDNNGNRTQAIQTDVSRIIRTTVFEYDELNRLITETKPNGTTLAYSYDAIGNKTQLVVTLPDTSQQTTTYMYDALNRLESVTDASGVTSYSYDAVGNRASVSYANNTSQVYAYDTLNRLQRLDSYNASGTLVQSFDYTVGATGRRTQVDELNGRSTHYVYDNLYRLTSETITDAANGNYTASYDYDRVGNRLYETVEGVQTAYTYDNNDRLLQSGGTTFTYDNQGNTLTQTLGGVVTSYTYNAQHELINQSQSGIATSFAYNADGIRNAKANSTTTTQFLVDNNLPYAQVIREDDGTTVVTFTYGDDLINQTRAGVPSFYLYDGLGSTRALTDVNGILTDSYDYEAFGEVLNQTGSTENNYLFAGEQLDQNLNQYYLRARYYNQGVGRFTQQDTYLGNNFDPVSLHKYLYANADPVMYTDPTGNFSLGSMMSAVNVMARLTTTAVRAGRSLFSSGSSSFASGAMRILNGSKQFLRNIAKKCKSKNDNNPCNYAKGFVEAEAKIQLKIMMTSATRVARGAKNRVVVVVGSFDVKRGRGTAAFNGAPVRVSPKLASHARKFLGLGIGDKHVCGNTVGRCAEWRSANNLLRTGSKIKNLRWTLAYFVDADGSGVQRGGIAPYCAICTGAFGLEN